MVVAQGLWLDTLDDLLGLGNEFVQLLIGADVELSKAAEARDQVLGRRVTENLGLSIDLARESFGQVFDQIGQLTGESLLRQLHSLVKARGYPLAFLFVESRIELLQVRRRFDAEH